MRREGFVYPWYREIVKHRFLLLISFILLILSTTVNYYAGNYADEKGSEVVADIILDNLPVVNLSFIFVYGFIFTRGLFFVYPLFFKVRKLSEVIAQFSLLVIIRSFFVLLTHLKAPLKAVSINFPGIFSSITFQNDLFFSGHTAFPFLGFLIFKESKIRYLFLGLSIVMGVTVLLMHQHYSIDVFAAFFIAYGSYKIGNFLFRKLENVSQLKNRS
jgi:membrane-associated phospholipid phosphatase